jgi:hypothetical protein
LYGSPISRHYHFVQPFYDEQQQQLFNASLESTGVRSTMEQTPMLVQATKINNEQYRLETGEADETSVASLDFAHADSLDVPGSWRYRSVPVRTVTRRHRAPLPQAFLDSQQYVSDSEQVVHPSSYRQQQLFGSIPTIHR